MTRPRSFSIRYRYRVPGFDRGAGFPKPGEPGHLEIRLLY